MVVNCPLDLYIYSEFANVLPLSLNLFFFKLVIQTHLGVRRMGPSSFQWCPVTGQGAMGTNWGTGSSVWTWGGTSSLWGWRSTGIVCPGRLWSLLLWRYSRPAWTRSCAAYCRWHCFGRGVVLDDPQRSLPTPTILWFCDSVILWKGLITHQRQRIALFSYNILGTLNPFFQDTTYIGYKQQRNSASSFLGSCQ